MQALQIWEDTPEWFICGSLQPVARYAGIQDYEFCDALTILEDVLDLYGGGRRIRDV